jgi:hypothetical protein
MSGPDFFELVGDEGTPEELERLRRAHELLIAAGPPPELSPRLAEAPATIGRTSWIPRRRRGAAFVLAAGVTAAAFGIGFLVGNRNPSDFSSRGRTVDMHGVAAGSRAHASILLGERDTAGNWQMLVRVTGLKALPEGQYYELYLTRKGKLAAYCGGFTVTSSGRTTVRFSVPYKLSKGRFDGWVITPSEPRRSPPVLLTT